MAVSPVDYVVVFVGALALTLLFTPLALRFAVRRGFFDRPGAIKLQAVPVPYLGGAAIVVAFAAMVLGAAVFRPAGSGGLGELAAALGVGVALSMVGLVDDLRGLPWPLRLGLELSAGLAVWATGSTAQVFDFAPADAAVTVLWVAGVTNAFNLLDNMDGLSAGVTAIASMFFFIVAAASGQFLVATLAIALSGCALGFLRHNFHPARIYMGDAGSMFLGFLLAVIGLRLRGTFSFFVPVLILGVALFDTTLVATTRLLNRRSPFSGGRDHTSHRLVFVGIPVPVAVSLIYVAGVALGWLGVVMARIDRLTSFILMGLVVTVAGFLGVLLGHVPVYQTSRRRHLMIQEVRRHEPEPEAPAERDEGVLEAMAHAGPTVAPRA